MQIVVHHEWSHSFISALEKQPHQLVAQKLRKLACVRVAINVAYPVTFSSRDTYRLKFALVRYTQDYIEVSDFKFSVPFDALNNTWGCA